jgi:phosphate transport system substrate-binding protein
VGGNLRSVGLGHDAEPDEPVDRQLPSEKHPAVRIQVEGKGSSTAPPALLETQAQFGPMSRAMSDEEKDRFVEKFGYAPTELRVAIDCIAIFVNKDNPLESLTLEQLERIFSIAGPEQMTWGDLGVEDPALGGPRDTLTGRNSASGTYKFFKKYACGGNDFKPTVQENPGSSGVVNAISRDPDGDRVLGDRVPHAGREDRARSRSSGRGRVPADPEYANSGDYPLARFLYLYSTTTSGEAIDPLREEFVG